MYKSLHPFFEFFNRDRPFIPKDSAEWPESWRTIEYKIYSRLPQIKLPEPDLRGAKLADAILDRKSTREFSAEPISLQELSTLLFFGAGITHRDGDENRYRRAHPSGGARFPIETYIAILNVSDLKKGVYHYNVLDHALEFLSETDRETIGKLSVYEFVGQSAFVVIFTMIPERSSRKYGNFALKVGLIEAGHIAQNMYLVASALKLKGSAVGNLTDELLGNELLGVDGISEVPFYLLAYGK